MSTVQLVYPEGKYKAVTFSYDDGPLADERLIALFNQYKLRGTFHLCDKWLDTEGKCASNLVASQYKGHEVAGHTASHPTLTRLAQEAIASEIIENRKQLERLVGYPVKGFSYPNGAYHTSISESLPAYGINYARTVQSTGQFYLPHNWLEWHPTCHHNDALLEKGKQFISMQRPQYLCLMYVWGHSYEFDRDQNWSMMERFCEMISSSGDIWFATNGELYNYIQQFNHLQFTVDCSVVFNPYATSVWLRVGDNIVEAIGGQLTPVK